MAINKKFIAIGSAGVLALGGAGLFAGVVGVNTAGDVGAGNAPLQASCATDATVAPQEATWNALAKKFQYTHVTLSFTPSVSGACNGQHATVNVYKADDGSELSSGTAAVANDAPVDITLTTAIDADIVDTDYDYGVVIQTAG